MPHFTCVPNPASPGSTVTICLTSPDAFPVYADVTFFDIHGAAFSGVGLRFTANRLCFNVVVPAGADHGLVIDNAGLIEDLLIRVS